MFTATIKKISESFSGEAAKADVAGPGEGLGEALPHAELQICLGGAGPDGGGRVVARTGKGKGRVVIRLPGKVEIVEEARPVKGVIIADADADAVFNTSSVVLMMLRNGTEITWCSLKFCR